MQELSRFLGIDVAMNYRLIAAHHVRDYVLFVAYADGISGEIDLADELTGEIFEPLKDVASFRQARFDPELRTVVWPNGAN